MALDQQHAAIHEAVHSVMQWSVGWGEGLRFIQMRRVAGGVDLAKTKAKRPAPTTLSTIRSTLVVLFAGTAALTDHFGMWMHDIDEDWREASIAVATYFAPRTLEMHIDNRVGYKDPEADSLVQSARAKSDMVVRLPPVSEAIRAVADLLINAASDDAGFCRVQAAQILAVCERVCGRDFPEKNDLVPWLRGN